MGGKIKVGGKNVLTARGRAPPIPFRLCPRWGQASESRWPDRLDGLGSGKEEEATGCPLSSGTKEIHGHQCARALRPWGGGKLVGGREGKDLAVFLGVDSVVRAGRPPL